MNVRASVAANSTTANILSGLLFERISSPGTVKYHLAASATGLQATVTLGGEVLAQQADIQVEEVADAGPNANIHFFGSDGVEGNEDQVISVTNTTAGALIVFAKVIIEEIV